MAKNLLSKYVWLAETIYKAGYISFEDINRAWIDADMDTRPIPIRTFHKWRIAIEELFGLTIENENRSQYRYFIVNANELRNGGMRSWLFNTLTVSNLMLDCIDIKERIMFEEIPVGNEYLPVIIKAIKANHLLYMTYQSYWRQKASSFEVEPYCLKAFKQRWYLVGLSPYYDKIMIYALDRIHELYDTGVKFDYPKDFSPEEYFVDCFGIIADKECKVEQIKIKVSVGQANYLRDLTLHQSQKEIERNDEYCVFEVTLRPTFDFQQEILSMGEDVEILKPIWLRKEIAGKIKRMWNKYNV